MKWAQALTQALDKPITKKERFLFQPLHPYPWHGTQDCHWLSAHTRNAAISCGLHSWGWSCDHQGRRKFWHQQKRWWDPACGVALGRRPCAGAFQIASWLDRVCQATWFSCPTQFCINFLLARNLSLWGLQCKCSYWQLPSFFHAYRKNLPSLSKDCNFALTFKGMRIFSFLCRLATRFHTTHYTFSPK